MAYEIAATSHARLLLDPQDWPARRARFLEQGVWVTPYAAAERYADGESMVASKGDDGLPVWTGRDRPINFFDRNPAIDLRREPQATTAAKP